MRRRLEQIPPLGWALGAVAAAVVIANLPYLLGTFDVNPLAQFSGLTTVTKAGVFPGRNFIDPNAGFTAQTLAHRAMLEWTNGQIPWWNPFEGTGAPLAGEMQSAAFFPPSLLVLLSNGQLWEHMLLELIGGWATVLLLRRLSVHPAAAAAAGIAFALTGTFAWFGDATDNPVAFLPVMLLGVEHAYAASLERRRGGWALLAGGAALAVLAGFPETTYLGALMVVCWALWRFVCLDGERPGLVRKLLLGAVVAALVTAPLLVAFADYLHVGQANTANLDNVHAARQALAQLLTPYVFGPIFGYDNSTLFNMWNNSFGGYLTATVVFLGLLGLFAGNGRRGLRVALGLWILVLGARMTALPPGLGHVFDVLPGMSHVWVWRYGMPAFSLSVIVLAALGLDRVARLPRRRLAVAGAALATLALIGLITILARPIIGGLPPGHHKFSRGSVLWEAGLVALAAGALMFAPSRLRLALAAAVVAVDVIAAFALPAFSAPRTVQYNTGAIRYLQRHAGVQRVMAFGSTLQPNYGSYFGVATANINDQPMPQNYANYVHSRLDPYADPALFVGYPLAAGEPDPLLELQRQLPAYQAAGISYAMTTATQTLPRRQFKLVFSSATARVYRIDGAAPYFSAGPGCRVHADSQTAATVSCAHPTTLIRRETAMPGWRASLDGTAARVATTDRLFQTVRVPAGRHTVTFSFRPPYELPAELACLAGLLMLAGSGWRRRRERRLPA